MKTVILGDRQIFKATVTSIEDRICLHSIFDLDGKQQLTTYSFRPCAGFSKARIQVGDHIEFEARLRLDDGGTGLSHPTKVQVIKNQFASVPLPQTQPRQGVLPSGQSQPNAHSAFPSSSLLDVLALNQPIRIFPPDGQAIEILILEDHHQEVWEHDVRIGRRKRYFQCCGLTCPLCHTGNRRRKMTYFSVISCFPGKPPMHCIYAMSEDLTGIFMRSNRFRVGSFRGCGFEIQNQKDNMGRLQNIFRFTGRKDLTNLDQSIDLQPFSKDLVSHLCTEATLAQLAQFNSGAGYNPQHLKIPLGQISRL